MRDDRTMFHFIFTDENSELPGDLPEQKNLLRKKFENSGWECRRILDALDSLDSLYLDRVSQIRMNPQQGLWSRGRVTLLGDAAFCISLLGGQGSALAMVAAYILAGELRRTHGDYTSAFTRYQHLFGPFVLQKQDAALRFAGAFAPKSKFALFLRNQIFKMLSVRWIANLTIVSIVRISRQWGRSTERQRKAAAWIHPKRRTRLGPNSILEFFLRVLKPPRSHKTSPCAPVQRASQRVK